MSSEIPEISSVPLVRRIVTGHDEDEKSKILYDDAQGAIQVLPSGGRFQTLWFTDEAPADCSSATDKDPTGNKTFQVANDGTVCTVVWMRPGSSSPMHITESIDYGVLLEGEVELELDNGERTLLKTGDVIVQRRTMHAWHNRHPTKWSKFFFVLIASKPEHNAKTAGNTE